MPAAILDVMGLHEGSPKSGQEFPVLIGTNLTGEPYSVRHEETVPD